MSNPLPLLIRDPVRRGAEHLELLLPDEPPVPLGGAQPVRSFNPGWRAGELFTLLDTLLILVLEHEDGGRAVWYLRRDGALSFPPKDCAEAERGSFAARLDPVALWLRMAPGSPIRLPLPPAAVAVSRLPREAREALAAVAASAEAAAALTMPVDATAASTDAAAADIVAVPVPGDDRRTLLGHPGALVPLTAAGRPVELQPGWRIDAVDAGAAPILCLPLSRESGERAVWYVDLHGRMLSHATSLLPPDCARHLSRRLLPLRDALWRRFVSAPEAAAPPDAVMASPLRLPPDDVAALASVDGVEGGVGRTRRWPLTEPPAPGTAYVVRTSRGLYPLDAELVRRALHTSSHREMERLLAEGRMVWPSPFDGSPVESDGFCFLLGADCFAYRFRHEALDATFLVVCTGTHFHNQAIWFPDADLLVGHAPHQLDNCAPWFANGSTMLLRHLLVHAPALLAGAALPVDQQLQQYFGACATHIGHYVWQDLAGMAFLLRGVRPGGRLPVLQLFSCDSNQSFFGPEEEVFPILSGRVHRHRHDFDRHVDGFYAANQRVIRYTAITIPRELGPSVLRAADAAPALRDVVAEADGWRRNAVAAGVPLLLLGLRVGNRAMADQEEFLGALIRRLAVEFPGCAVILDGLNDRDDRGDVVSPAGAFGGDVSHELRVAAALAAVARDCGVRFRSNVNRSARVSVVWGARADAFLAPWGAALCKYRWICNTPGFAVSSRWNLEHRHDLRIYDAPAALEGATELRFNAPDTARDLDPARDEGGFDGRGDFVVAREPVFAKFVALVRERLRARGG